MEATTLGITVLGGDTRVRTNGQLIRLEDLASTPGPPGLQGEKGDQGIQGEPGQDGADGTVDTTKFYNKAQVDFLLATNTPSIGVSPGAGVNVWDNGQDLMRNLVGQKWQICTLTCRCRWNHHRRTRNRWNRSCLYDCWS